MVDLNVTRYTFTLNDSGNSVTLTNGTSTSFTLNDGAPGTGVEGNILVWNDNGGVTAYNSASDSNAARGTILKSTVNNASAGETVVVRPGVYDCNGLVLKAGVNIHFMNGAEINYSGTADGALFIDSGAEIDSIISGEGIFRHQNSGSTGNAQVFNMTGTGTLTAYFDSMYAEGGVAFRRGGAGETGGTYKLYFDYALSSDGTIDSVSNSTSKIYIVARELSSTNNFVLEMDGGLIDCTAKIIRGSAAAETITTASPGTIVLRNAEVTGTSPYYVNVPNVKTNMVFINCYFEGSEDESYFQGNATFSSCSVSREEAPRLILDAGEDYWYQQIDGDGLVEYVRISV